MRRNALTNATWGESAYQGWVYGYGPHAKSLSQARAGRSRAVTDCTHLDQKTGRIRNHLRPQTLTAEDGYTKAKPIQQ